MSERDRRSLFKQSMAFLSQVKRRSLLALLVIGVAVAVVGWIGLDIAVQYTNTTEFCLSCHEMKLPYEEWQRTTHFKNRSGVSVGCAECHVPRDQPAKLLSKLHAIDDVYRHFLGTIDTPEKFNSKRLAMAEEVWERMWETRSAACRSCHSFTAMDLAKQSDRPRRKHADAMKTSKSCIDCHKGVAHALPRGFRNDDY